MYVDIMASILRVISNDLYLNLVERNLIYPKTSTETDSFVEEKELDKETLPKITLEDPNPTTNNTKALCKKYKFWEPFDKIFKGTRK
jgi:hypothetical protein